VKPRQIYVCVVLVALTQSGLFAAAGLSDIAATRACWIRSPFALVKCQSENGRYPARIVRARSTTPDESSSGSLVPAGYDGIVPLDTVVDNVDSVAQAGRFMVAKQRVGRVIVVDLNAPDEKPTVFATVDAANAFLARHGVLPVGEAEFRSFESVYREFGPPISLWALVNLAGGAVVCGAVFLWARRRGRRIVSPAC